MWGFGSKEKSSETAVDELRRRVLVAGVLGFLTRVTSVLQGSLAVLTLCKPQYNVGGWPLTRASPQKRRSWVLPLQKGKSGTRNATRRMQGSHRSLTCKWKQTIGRDQFEGRRRRCTEGSLFITVIAGPAEPTLGSEAWAHPPATESTIPSPLPPTRHAVDLQPRVGTFTEFNLRKLQRTRYPVPLPSELLKRPAR